MPRTRAAKSEAIAAQPLELLSGFEALHHLERTICVGAVTRDPAEAEGLASAGVRAASLPDGPPAGAAGGVSVRGTSCVHHVRAAPGCGGEGAFELSASSAQEAVDHCLVAHRLSLRIGRAGLCSLAPSIAGGLDLVSLPDRALLAGALDGEAAAAESDAGPGRILDLAREAFSWVSERTERPGGTVDYRGDPAAEVVLVAWGAEADGARETAQALSQAAVPAGALVVNLVRPFPAREVREALASARTAFVIDSPARSGALLASIEAAIGEETEVQSLPHAAPARLLEALAERLPKHDLDAARHARPLEPLRRRLLVAPAGPWGEETVRQVAAALRGLGPLRVAGAMRSHLGATVLAWDGEGLGGGGDLLLVSHPALLGRRSALGLLRAGGSVLLLSAADSPAELARHLGREVRALLRERELRVHWVGPPEVPLEGDAEGDRASSLVLAGAALALVAGKASGKAAEGVAGALERAGRAHAARWLRAGAKGVQAVERDVLDSSQTLEELDFRPAPALPRMPEPVDDPAQRERWAQRIRRFHRTGRGVFGPLPQLPVRPAALRSLAARLRRSARHPFVLIRSDADDAPIAARGLRDLVAEGLAALADDGRAARVLADNAERLVLMIARQLAQRPPGARLRSLVSEAGRQLGEELALPAEEREVLAADLEGLGGHLPDGAVVVEIRDDTPLRLYLEALDAVRGPLRRAFLEELRGLRERLRDLLQLDRMQSSEGRAPQALAATLGSAGAEYLDPEALSRTLPGGSGSQDLDPVRRRRIEQSLERIDHHLDHLDRMPPLVLVHPPGFSLAVEAEQREHPDPLAAAVGVFDGLARRMGDLFAAVRTARLESAGHYRPELHDEALSQLDWESLTADELLVVPAVAALTTGRRLRQRDRASLSELLRSSRPVHVIVRDRVGAPEEAEDLSRFHVDLGYLVVAHREAFAVGSTLVRPDRLVEGLVRAARALRPAVALVSLPAPEPGPGRALLAEAALEGRACPDFLYDPDGGQSWVDRFDLTPNPQPERPWPVHGVEYLENGETKTLEVAFTFADAVALEPAYLRHLRVIPRVAWDEAQIPLAEYMEGFDPEGREGRIPYLWVVDESETLQRAVVTRELAMACGDRLRAWRILQELAGYENVFAERAAAAARVQAQTEAEEQRAELERSHAEELERARRAGAEESIERLAAVLLSPEELAAPLPAALAPPPPAAPLEVPPAAGAAEAAAPAPAEEAVEEEELVSFDEAYIDCPLCTTCNECTNLNSRMFQYNADKQAFIADPAAGTFEELVKAAELCPARCIHPGNPRKDDPTASADLIARAGPFNA
jgi:hypothetical protein